MQRLSFRKDTPEKGMLCILCYELETKQHSGYLGGSGVGSMPLKTAECVLMQLCMA